MYKPVTAMKAKVMATAGPEDQGKQRILPGPMRTQSCKGRNCTGKVGEGSTSTLFSPAVRHCFVLIKPIWKPSQKKIFMRVISRGLLLGTLKDKWRKIKPKLNTSLDHMLTDIYRHV